MRYEYTNGYFMHTKQKPGPRAAAKNIFHIHDEYEIIYVFSGSPAFFIAGSSYICMPGDIILLRGLEIHSIPEHSIKNSVQSSIQFSPDIIRNVFHEGTGLLGMFDDRQKGDRNHIRPDMKSGIILRALFERFDVASVKGCAHAASKTFVQLLNILHVINEIKDTHACFVPKNCLSQDLTEVIKYVDANIRNELNLNELGDLFYLSPQHLTRVFKKHTGSTIYDYIISKRIALAKDHIKKGASLGYSSSAAGFSNYSSFYKAFKTRLGFCPAHYARKLTNDT